MCSQIFDFVVDRRGGISCYAPCYASNEALSSYVNEHDDAQARAMSTVSMSCTSHVGLISDDIQEVDTLMTPTNKIYNVTN